jgi:hypothetical protein
VPLLLLLQLRFVSELHQGSSHIPPRCSSSTWSTSNCNAICRDTGTRQTRGWPLLPLAHDLRPGSVALLVANRPRLSSLDPASAAAAAVLVLVLVLLSSPPATEIPNQPGGRCDEAYEQPSFVCCTSFIHTLHTSIPALASTCGVLAVATSSICRVRSHTFTFADRNAARIQSIVRALGLPKQLREA